MFPYRDLRQNPFYNQFRGVSPPQNDAERPRRGWYPNEYARVSPMPRERELEFPDFSRIGSGYGNMHYPRRGRRDGFWQGGAPGEWEHWR